MAPCQIQLVEFACYRRRSRRAAPERLRSFIPFAEALSQAVVRRIIPPDAVVPYTQREPPFHDVAVLWENRDTYCTTAAGKLALARYVKARLSDGASHPRIATITQTADEQIVLLEGAVDY